jgi:hypothetical protein
MALISAAPSELYELKDIVTATIASERYVLPSEQRIGPSAICGDEKGNRWVLCTGAGPSCIYHISPQDGNAVTLLTGSVKSTAETMLYGNGALYVAERGLISRVDCKTGTRTIVEDNDFALFRITSMCWAVGSTTVMLLCDLLGDTIYRLDTESPDALSVVVKEESLNPASICQHVGVGVGVETYIVGANDERNQSLYHLTIDAAGKGRVRSIISDKLVGNPTINDVVVRGGLVLCSVDTDGSSHYRRTSVVGMLYNHETGYCDTSVVSKICDMEGRPLPCDYIRCVDGTDDVLLIDMQSGVIHTVKLPSTAWCTSASYLLPWLSRPVGDNYIGTSFESLTNALWAQAKTGTRCDVELRCGAAWSMKAHKLVLSASSSYFRAMFDSGCVEGLPSSSSSNGDSTTIVEVGDVTHTWAVKTLLRWMYTRDINVRVVVDNSMDEDNTESKDEASSSSSTR